MKRYINVLGGIVLGMLVARPVTPASAHGYSWGGDEKLDRILAMLEQQKDTSTVGQVSWIQQQLSSVPRWEYRCDAGFGHPWTSTAEIERMNLLGRAGWELGAALHSPDSDVLCFKRLLRDDGLSPIDTGESGCAPLCGPRETCFRHECIEACATPCLEGDYCGKDRRCHSRRTAPSGK